MKSEIQTEINDKIVYGMKERLEGYEDKKNEEIEKYQKVIQANVHMSIIAKASLHYEIYDNKLTEESIAGFDSVVNTASLGIDGAKLKIAAARRVEKFLKRAEEDPEVAQFVSDFFTVSR